MPNHVTNRLTCSKRVRDFLKPDPNSEEQANEVIDFGKVVPFPEELQGTVSPPPKVVPIVYEDTEPPSVEELIRREHEQEEDPSVRLIEKYGHDNWYDWKVANWGTKWNAYDSVEDEDVLVFDTAWSMPITFYQRLAGLFPDETMSIVWADEDWGSNFGRATIAKGKLQINPCQNINDNGAMETLEEIFGDISHHFEQVDGQWKWKEEDEEEAP